MEIKYLREGVKMNKLDYFFFNILNRSIAKDLDNKWFDRIFFLPTIIWIKIRLK